MKIGGEHGDGTEKQGFDDAKWLANPTAGRRITQTTCTSQFNPMNNRSNGKSRLKPVILSVAKNLSLWQATRTTETLRQAQGLGAAKRLDSSVRADKMLIDETEWPL